jgi:hypothetical protein
MSHPYFLNFGNQGKENHYKCVILLLSNLGTRERGNHDQSVIRLRCDLEGNNSEGDHYECVIHRLWDMETVEKKEFWLMRHQFFIWFKQGLRP